MRNEWVLAIVSLIRETALIFNSLRLFLTFISPDDKFQQDLYKKINY